MNTITTMNAQLIALRRWSLQDRMAWYTTRNAHERVITNAIAAAAADASLEALRTIKLKANTWEETWRVKHALNRVAAEKGVELCQHCFNVIEDEAEALEIGNDNYCCHECAHEAGWYECDYCGEWTNTDDGITIETWRTTSYYCDHECAEHDGWRMCERCEEWAHEDDMRTVHVCGTTEQWCDGCVDYSARFCERCEEYYHEDEVCYDEDEDINLCDNCREHSHPGTLHEYGYTPRLSFHGDAKKSPYLGTEWETDGGDDRDSYVRDLAGIEGFDEHFWMTRDGSLRNGVEITSHPCTLAYHANELEAVYGKIRDTALNYGFKSHDGGRCGLHVHVNRDFFGMNEDSQDVGGYKMMRLLQRFERNFTKFSRRRDNGWCNYYTDLTYGPDVEGEPDSPRRVLDKAKDMKRERKHEQALNFQHIATFEFRIFRGTLLLSTYFACLGMVNGLCHVAKQHSAHYVETVEWSKLMADVIEACDEPKSREHLRAYLESKELL